MKLSVALLFTTLAFAAEEAPEVRLDAKHQQLFKETCVSCHGPDKQKGKFRIDQLPLKVDTVETAERWQKVLNQINSGEMPPEDKKQPSAAAKTELLDDLSNMMVAARKKLGDQNGVITMRRLNRREYRNSLRELLGVEINVSELPPDIGSGVFDTVGSNLFMSGNQFEQYQALGREALEEASVRLSSAATKQHLRWEAKEWTGLVDKYVKYEIDARERAIKWKAAFDAAAAKPENAVIVAELKKQTNNKESRLRREWEKIPGAPNPRTFGFDKKGENDADLANDSLNPYFLPYHQFYLAQPALDKGAYLAMGNTVHPAVLKLGWMDVLVPFHWPAGEYVARIRVAATKQAPDDRRYIEFGINPLNNGQVSSTHQVTGTMEAPQIIEAHFSLTRKSTDRRDRIIFFREKGSCDTNEQYQSKFSAAKKLNGIGPELALWVDYIDIDKVPTAQQPLAAGLAHLGLPLEDNSPAPTKAALRKGLESFSREAFRGKLAPTAFIDRLLKLYDVRIAAGDKPSAALKETLSVVLASPMFLYLSEPAPEGKRRPLNDLELATRLSYFLWSAPPDATLRELAQKGELAKPDVLAAQAERLLNHPNAETFNRAFHYQWLGLGRLDFFQVNLELYPRFDNSTKLAAKNEVYETTGHLLRTNGSLRNLLKSDYAILNSVLAEYYGIKDVTGDMYRKVSLPKDSPRGGLLGMAAIHLMGGNGERTSPVERGAWVLRKLLHDAPPPAPANIPALTRLAGKALETKERLRAHQEDPQCANCHRKIDPIGFGLENFDAAGQWRTTDSIMALDAAGKPDKKSLKTWTIDSAAALYKGPAFKDYYGLRDIVASKSDAFARGFSEALIEYALGRPVGFRDQPLIDSMVGQAERKDLAVREFIHSLVASPEFHTK